MKSSHVENLRKCQIKQCQFFFSFLVALVISSYNALFTIFLKDSSQDWFLLCLPGAGSAVVVDESRYGKTPVVVVLPVIAVVLLGFR